MNKIAFDIFVILNILASILCVLGILYLNPIFWSAYLIFLMIHYYYRLTKDFEFKQYVKK